MAASPKDKSAAPREEACSAIASASTARTTSIRASRRVRVLLPPGVPTGLVNADEKRDADVRGVRLGEDSALGLWG